MLCWFQRESDQTHLKDGYLALSGLQVRGHAMFSHEGLALDAETLEYAWLVEAVVGDVSGRLTCPQVGDNRMRMVLGCPSCVLLKGREVQ